MPQVTISIHAWGSIFYPIHRGHNKHIFIKIHWIFYVGAIQYKNRVYMNNNKIFSNNDLNVKRKNLIHIIESYYYDKHIFLLIINPTHFATFILLICHIASIFLIIFIVLIRIFQRIVPSFIYT